MLNLRVHIKQHNIYKHRSNKLVNSKSINLSPIIRDDGISSYRNSYNIISKSILHKNIALAFSRQFIHYYTLDFS